MTAPVAPWAALAVRAHLLADDRVTGLFGDRVGTRPPANVTGLHAVVQAPNAPGLDLPRHGFYRPMVLVEARAAAAAETGGDPEDEVMAAASLLAAVLAGARNVRFENAYWSTVSSTGAFALPVDDSRGVAVFRGAAQGEISLRASRV